MFASTGEIGDPCGVPDTVSVIIPFSSTPTRSQDRSSLSMSRSDTLRSMSVIRASCEMEPKQLLRSASRTQSAPRLASTRMASQAIWADRFGRNPKLTGRKSASKTGSRTILAAAITTRSRTFGIDRGRDALLVVSPALGMYTRRSGAGR